MIDADLARLGHRTAVHMVHHVRALLVREHNVLRVACVAFARESECVHFAIDACSYVVHTLLVVYDDARRVGHERVHHDVTRAVLYPSDDRVHVARALLLCKADASPSLRMCCAYAELDSI